MRARNCTSVRSTALRVWSVLPGSLVIVTCNCIPPSAVVSGMRISCSARLPSARFCRKKALSRDGKLHVAVVTRRYCG